MFTHMIFFPSKSPGPGRILGDGSWTLVEDLNLVAGAVYGKDI